MTKFFYFHSFINRKALLCFSIVLFLFAPTMQVQANSEQDMLSRIKTLDAEFRELSAEIHRTKAKDDQYHKQIEDNSEINSVSEKLNLLIEQNKLHLAVSYIYSNFALIESNIDESTTITAIRLLLSLNDFYTASHLKQKINDSGDPYFDSTVALVFAEYYNHRDEWQNVLTALQIDLDELTDEDQNHAYLLKGIALQEQKKHRDAISFYKKISAQSQHYRLAQLNTAIAYIRQDWWTDAHIIINQLIKDSNVSQNEELMNRLFLILGFSLLNKEYYRESRESFRNISLESQYTNRALLGLSLAAIGQGDSKGALNTTSILNKRKTGDLVTEESYLLLPHIYKNLEQFMTANSSYTVAINYYQNRIDELNRQLTLDNVIDFNNYQEADLNNLNIAGTNIKLSELFPPYFIQNYIQMKTISARVNSPKLLEKIDNFNKSYTQLFQHVIKESLTLRLTALQSYLSQAHFGVAQLYDNDHE